MCPSEDGPMDWTEPARPARRHAVVRRWQGAALHRRRRPVPDPHRHRASGTSSPKRRWRRSTPSSRPMASTVAFRRGWDLYTVDVATGKETRLTRDGTETLRNGVPDWVYPEELDLGTAFWWSPDSKSHRLPAVRYQPRAGLSARGPAAHCAPSTSRNAIRRPARTIADVHLGVVAAAGGPTSWLEVGDTRNAYLIARAGWMPNSRACTCCA